MMELKNILKNITYKGNPDSRNILSITHDSKKVKPGTLFIAIKGEKNDGHDFIFDAINKGAVAVVANGRAPLTNKVPVIQVSNPRKTMSKLAANFFKNPSKKLKIIGITGTNGKTTTTQIIDYILKKNKYSSSSLGTLGFISPNGIVSTGYTTPESIELQQILSTIKKGGIEYVSMEVSSHAIEMNRVDDVNIDFAIFTNLGYDHLDFHGNRENYFISKLKLFKKLDKTKHAIINLDDPYSDRIIKNLNCNYYTYGFTKKADLFIEDYSLNFNFSTISIRYNEKCFKIKTHLIGKFNLYNLIASILCCIKLGIDIKLIIKSISSFKNVSGRFEKYAIPNKRSLAIVDYAHSPDAFEKIYKTIFEFKQNKNIITIFGCGGDRDRNKRAAMAKIAEKFSDFIYITNDNPRNEDPKKIIDDIISGFIEKKYEIVYNRKEAINKALKKINNSILLILGKGIEEYQLIGDSKILHSDIGLVKEYINENKN